MTLTIETCHRALVARDSRFDGRFFTAVASTGIYCRPICPARTPLRCNRRFFASAAAAEDAGYRPCLRCRPEAAPQTPAARGTEATVGRALRLIAEGDLDDRNLRDFAERLGVGDRHLRRLFQKHVGASPLKVARTARVQLAKRLLDESRLSVDEIASAAGFASSRRLGAALHAVYGRGPRELRGNRVWRGADTTLRLRFRGPFAWPELLGFLALRATPGVEFVDDHEYARSVRVGEATGTIAARLAPDGSHLEISVTVTPAVGLLPVVGKLNRLFDLCADPVTIASDLRGDRLLASSLKSCPGLRVPGAWDGFELAVRAILGQQVSVKGASTLCGRLAARFGTPLPTAHETLSTLFPDPLSLIDAEVETIGLPKARAETIRLLARAVASGSLRLDGTLAAEEVYARLTAIAGIGEWTAAYIGMRALADPDAFPAGDLVLARQIGNGETANRMAVLTRAEAWRPWRAYAAMHLWRASASKEKS